MLTYRTATRDDLPAIVKMLADDELGRERERYEDPLPDGYLEAFDAIDRDPNNQLILAELEGRVVGVLQLTLIPNLTYQGSWRALIEGVRVASDARGAGVGRQLLEWAIAEAARRGCRMVELTTNKSRPRAISFYESLGFESTHEGMKYFIV